MSEFKIKWKVGIVLILLQMELAFRAEISAVNIAEACELCTFEESILTLTCKGLNLMGNSSLNLLCLPVQQKNEVITLNIVNSNISILDFSFIEENNLTQLSRVIANGSNINKITGAIPCTVTELNMQSNQIRNFNATLEKNSSDRFSANVSNSSALSSACKSRQLTLYLRKNFLETLPVDVASSDRLNSTYLSGNPLMCEFIWETIWENPTCQNRSDKCRSIFMESDSTICQFNRHALFSTKIFDYNLKEIFDSKITLTEECSKMNETCECNTFNLLRENGKPTVYLSINCHDTNLTKLPEISKFTWALNVSNNHIHDFHNLNSPTYHNLRILDLSHNYIGDLTPLANSTFLDRFDSLYINSNKFHKIPDIFFASAKRSNGKGMLKIGSELECECHTATNTKGRMIELQYNIMDVANVVCKNFFHPIDGDNNENEYSTSSNFKLTDLKVNDVCPSPNDDSAHLNWLIALIVFELFAIFAVVSKVFYDWREYQRTGILPWIAQKLPRLPCDSILE